MKKHKILITAILSAIALTACSLESTEQPTTSIAKVSEQGTTEKTTQAETTEAETTTESNLPEYAKVGEMVCSDTWNVALLYAKEYDSIDSDFFQDKPTDGNKYLALFFDVKNVSGKNDFFNTMYFEGYADDYSVNAQITLNKPDDYPSVGGDVDAGRMSRGVIVYEVPADWSKFEIVYKDGIWTSHKTASFVIGKEDLSPTDYVFDGLVHGDYVFDESLKTEIGTEINDDSWNVKFLDYKTYDSLGDGFLEEKAKDGHEFAVFFLEAKNTSSADDYFNSLYFRSYVDGYLTDSSIVFGDIDGYSSMSGDVASGKMIKGYIAFEIPKEWKNIEVIYDDGTLVENKVAVFAVTNK